MHWVESDGGEAAPYPPAFSRMRGLGMGSRGSSKSNSSLLLYFRPNRVRQAARASPDSLVLAVSWGVGEWEGAFMVII